jgi:N-acetylmuramoyl-L-alanine amidase
LPPKHLPGRGNRSLPNNSGILNSVRRAFFCVALLAVAGAAPLLTASSLQQPRPSQAAAAFSASDASKPGAPRAQNASGATAAHPAQAMPAPQTPAPTTVVVLDPAHGGSDTGARGPSGVVESEIVLDFARAIRTTLEAQGLRVLLTREGNQNPSFDDRSAMVNGLSGAVFISLHVSSTGPIGTARAYWYAFPPGAEPPPMAPAPAAGGTAPRAAPGPTLGPAPGPAPALHPGLIDWQHAQLPYADWSRRLAELVQIQLAQRFPGSGEIPQAAPVRQLRSIAAPAIAIELSSVAVPDTQQLEQMSQLLAGAIGRAISDFQRALGNGATRSGGG